MMFSTKVTYFLLWGLLWNLPAFGATLAPHSTRQSPQDLEVVELLNDGSYSPTRFYTYQQLSTLPQVTVSTKIDPNTGQPASYTGIYLKDLAPALGAKPDETVLGMICYDQYRSYYDPFYIAKHQPIFLLKFNGKIPEQWPQSLFNTSLGPYCVVHENFPPAQPNSPEPEDPRIPFGVVRVELSSPKASLDKLSPLRNVNDPEVLLGYRLAVGSCLNCHNLNNIGGQLSGRPWNLLAGVAVTNREYFRSYILNPQKLNPTSRMQAHPQYTEATLKALEAYFRSTLAEIN